MEKHRDIVFFNNFYGILQEAEYFRDRNEIVKEAYENEDDFIFKQLNRIKRHKAEYIASQKKSRIAKFDLVISALKSDNRDALNNLLGEKYSTQAYTLYNNFKNSSDKDSKEVEDEQIYLSLLEIFEDEENT